MDHDALIERIMKLDLQTLEAMSPEVMARLTNLFNESLVRKLLYVETTNYGQRKIIKLIKGAYESWMKDDLVWGITKSYPEYMEELQMDIECGLVITEKGTFEEDSWAKLTNSLIHSNAVSLNAFKKGIQSVLSEDERISVVDDDNLKSITEEQPNSISYPNESETDNNNAPININENQSADENLRKQLADAQKTIEEQAQTIKELKEEIAKLKEEKNSTKSNEQYNIEINRLKIIHEDTLVTLLKPAFFNIEDDTRDFLKRIQGLDNQGVTDVARQFLKDRKIAPSKQGRFIWNILTAAKLYSRVEQNWTAALRKTN